MKRHIIGSAFALSLVPSAAFATCISPTSYSPDLAALSTDTTDSSSNMGVYSWNTDTRTWRLEEETYVAEAEQDQLMSGDVIISSNTFGDGLSSAQSGGGSGGGGGGGNYHLQRVHKKGDVEILGVCDDPIDMPNVVVTAPPQPSPGTSITTIIFRTVRNAFSPNGGGHGRPVTGGVKQGSKLLNCQSDNIDREMEALRVLGRPYQRGLYLIRFGQNDSQFFVITNPTLSDGGIIPNGKCIDR